jgi:hypothetical protein
MWFGHCLVLRHRLPSAYWCNTAIPLITWSVFAACSLSPGLDTHGPVWCFIAYIYVIQNACDDLAVLQTSHLSARLHDGLMPTPIMLNADGQKLLIVLLFLFGFFSHPAVPSHGGEGSRAPPHSTADSHGHRRSLQQLGRPWIDNGGTWPAGFSDLDKAVETQRIFRAVLAER